MIIVIIILTYTEIVA